MAIKHYKKPKVYSNGHAVRKDKGGRPKMPINHQRYGDGYGYNERQLRALLVLSRDMNVSRSLQRILRLSGNTVRESLAKGNFTRNEIALLAKECGWTPEQVASAFFDVYGDEKEGDE